MSAHKGGTLNELMRLELLDAALWLHTGHALTALATKHFLDTQFYDLPEEKRMQVFKTNVANNILYAANDALIDRSIIMVFEHIKREDKLSPLTIEIPDKSELRKHRIVLSHPGTTRFDTQKVQKFFDDREQYKDGLKAARLWRTREAVIQYLKSIGSTKAFPNEAKIMLGTIDLIHAAYNLSLREGQQPASLEDLRGVVPGYFQKYNEALKRLGSSLFKVRSA